MIISQEIFSNFPKKRLVSEVYVCISKMRGENKKSWTETKSAISSQMLIRVANQVFGKNPTVAIKELTEQTKL